MGGETAFAGGRGGGGESSRKEGGEGARYAVGPGRRGQRESGCAATSSLLHRIKFLSISTPVAVDRLLKVDFAARGR